MHDTFPGQTQDLKSGRVRGPLALLVPLLVFMIFLPIEVPVFEIQGGVGEKIGISWEHVHGAIVARRSVAATVSLTDFAFLLCFAVFFANFLMNRNLKIPYLRFYIPVALLLVGAFAALLLNTGGFSANQRFVSGLYTVKSAIYSFSFVFLAAYLGQGYSLGPIFRTMVLALLFASVVGATARFVPELGPLIVNDRPSYFGPTLVLAMAVLFLAMNPMLMERYQINRSLAYLSLLFAFVAIALSGKRGITVGLMLGIIGATYRDLGLRALVILCMFAVSSLIGFDIFVNKTFQEEGRLLFAFADPELQPYLQKLPYWLLSYQFAGFSLDASLSVRLVRYVAGFYIGMESPLLGVGLHSAQYKAFLPDNGYIGTFMETGVVGVLLLVVYVARYVGRTKTLRQVGAAKGVGGIIAALLGMALGVQVVDVFSIVAMFLMVTLMIIHLSYLAESSGVADPEDYRPVSG